MSFTLRLASDADSAAAVAVIREVYDEYGFTWDEGDYHADLYAIDDYYTANNGCFWIAYGASGEPIGTAALERFAPVPGDKLQIGEVEGQLRIGGSDSALQRLYVRPKARKSGLGSALMRLVVSTAQDSGCELLEIWSDKRFSEAHRLYQKFGAEVVGDRICHDPDQSPEWGLALDLKRNSPAL